MMAGRLGAVAIGGSGRSAPSVMSTMRTSLWLSSRGVDGVTDRGWRCTGAEARLAARWHTRRKDSRKAARNAALAAACLRFARVSMTVGRFLVIG